MSMKLERILDCTTTAYTTLFGFEFSSLHSLAHQPEILNNPLLMLWIKVGDVAMEDVVVCQVRKILRVPDAHTVLQRPFTTIMRGLCTTFGPVKNVAQKCHRHRI